MARRFNFLDQCACFCVENHAVAVVLLKARVSAQDGYVVGIDLCEDRILPRREVWDVNDLPCRCSQPEHLHFYEPGAFVTKSTCDVDLLSYTD